MAGLPLQGSGQSLRGGYLSEDAHEDQMPTHVIWGDVESLSRDQGGHSTEQSGSRTGSGSERVDRPPKTKLKNKRLSRDDIQFRSPASGEDKTSESSSRTPSIGKASSGVGTSSEVLRLAAWEVFAEQHGMAGRNAGQQAHQAQHEENDSDNSEEHHGPSQPQQVLPNILSPEEAAAVEASVRRNEDGKATSLGSAGHPDNCKPCLFVFTVVGCQNGVFCTFCHFKHKRGNRPRPCKGKRNRYRKLMERMETLQCFDKEEQPQQEGGAAQSSAQASESDAVRQTLVNL